MSSMNRTASRVAAQPQPQVKQAQAVSNLTKPKGSRKLLYIGGGLVVYGVVVAGAYFVHRGNQAASKPRPVETFNDAYDQHATEYDDTVGKDETWIGVGLMRFFLAKHANGDVLEVSAGTGRNLPAFAANGKEIRSLIMTDSSANMLNIARNKAEGLKAPFRVDVAKQDAERLPFPDATFDTVVDTFGLCSCHDPKSVLAEMARVVKPGGKLLLLEHGRSHYTWLSGLLDEAAPAHAEKWGCWWNRDLDALFHSANLKLHSYKRFHFGTTYYVVAEPIK